MRFDEAAREAWIVAATPPVLLLFYCCLFPNLILIACVVLSHETRGVHNRDIDIESIESEACCPFLPFALSWSYVGDGLRSAI